MARWTFLKLGGLFGIALKLGQYGRLKILLGKILGTPQRGGQTEPTLLLVAAVSVKHFIPIKKGKQEQFQNEAQRGPQMERQDKLALALLLLLACHGASLLGADLCTTPVKGTRDLCI
jgi:hypothetical protein